GGGRRSAPPAARWLRSGRPGCGPSTRPPSPWLAGCLGSWRASLTAAVSDGFAAFARASLPGGRPVLGGHQRKEVGQRPSGLVLESVAQDLQMFDAVEAEIAESIAHFAPGGQRPALAPVRETQR